VYKLKYTIKTHSYNTQAMNIDKTGVRGKTDVVQF